jgi:hypothetical protein
MPPVRESLKRTKTRSVVEQKNRTERRVRELLNPQQTGSEIFDGREEENRVSARQARRFNRDKATQTDSSSTLSFCCGVFSGVFLVACLIVCLIVFVPNDRQRVAQ